MCVTVAARLEAQVELARRLDVAAAGDRRLDDARLDRRRRFACAELGEA